MDLIETVHKCITLLHVERKDICRNNAQMA